MKLLLVEDSERLRQTLQHGLQGAGFTVDAAGDGVEACGFLTSYDYDLVVLDLMLPRLDGIGVLRSLPAGGRRPRVLVLSARDQVPDRIEALNAGADDYLMKPFAFDELVARLHALARRPQQAQPLAISHGSLSWATAAARSAGWRFLNAPQAATAKSLTAALRCWYSGCAASWTRLACPA